MFQSEKQKTQMQIRIETRRLRNIALREQNGECFYCYESLSCDACTADHKEPQISGGQTVRENIVASCFDCNQAKGMMSFNRFVKSLEFFPRSKNGRPQRPGVVKAWARRRINLALKKFGSRLSDAIELGVMKMPENYEDLPDRIEKLLNDIVRDEFREIDRVMRSMTYINEFHGCVTHAIERSAAIVIAQAGISAFIDQMNQGRCILAAEAVALSVIRKRAGIPSTAIVKIATNANANIRQN